MAFGGAALGLKARLIAGAVSTMVADADLALSATEVAVTVTELLVAEGRADGAVYVVEVVGPAVLNEPHAAPLAEHITDHLTPAFVESFASVTVSDAAAFTWSEDGGVEEKEMEIGTGGVVIEDGPPAQAASAPLAQITRNSKIRRWINIVVPNR